MFELSWYSISENKFYKDTFSLDQQKLKVRQEYSGQMMISDLLINILPNGNADLLINKDSSRDHLLHYRKVDFTSVENKSLDEIFKLFDQKKLSESRIERLKENHEKLIKNTTSLLSAEEILNFRSVHSYAIDVEIKQKEGERNQIKEIKVIDMYLNKYSRSADFLKEIHEKPLPSFIEVQILNNKESRRYIKIVFDRKALLNQFNTFESKSKGDLTLGILIDAEKVSRSKIHLKSRSKRVVLTHWRVIE